MKISKLLILLAPLCLVNCGGGNNTPDPASAQTPLCFTCTSDTGGLLSVFQFSTEAELCNLQYSHDNKNWQNVDFPAGQQRPFILTKDETIYFRGDNANGFNFIVNTTGDTKGRCTSFVAPNGEFNIGGNVMSLIKSEGFDTLFDIPNDYCFAGLFSLLTETEMEYYPSRFVDASKLTLPATNLKKNCYMQMFGNDYLLKFAPTLPATKLAESCYEGMFKNCYSLKKVQVAFKEDAFDQNYSYTENWFFNEPLSLNDEEAPVFVWPGDLGSFERNESTIPEGWDIQKV